VINKAVESYGWRFNSCYDVVLRNCGVRGFYVGTEFRHCDKPTVNTYHAMRCGFGIRCLGAASDGSSGVGGAFRDIYFEACQIVSVISSGRINGCRSETGYNASQAATGAPTSGAYTLPSSATWTISQGGSTVNFTWAGSYDASDYFHVGSVIRVTPSEATEPEIYLHITAVGTTTITFDQSTNTSYIRRSGGLSGTGAGITRFFGSHCILWGDEAALHDYSFADNYKTANLPSLFIQPNAKPIIVDSNTTSKLLNTNLLSCRPVVVACNAGSQGNLQASVDYRGSTEVPNNPLVNPNGIGPFYDDNIRAAIYDPFSDRMLYKPGRGVTTLGGSGTAARNLTFHYWGNYQAPGMFLGNPSSETVSNAAFSPTATEFEGSSTSIADTDYYRGYSIFFTSGTGVTGYAANIVGYSRSAGGRTHYTVRGLATAPPNGATFVVLGQPVPCYRPADESSGWLLPRIRKPGQPATLTITAYSPDTSAAPSLSIYGGGTGTPAHTMEGGWETFPMYLATGNMSVSRDYITLFGTGEAYVSQVIVSQDTQLTLKGKYTLQDTAASTTVVAAAGPTATAARNMSLTTGTPGPTATLANYYVANGTTDNINCTTSTSFHKTGPFTVCTWVNTSNTAQNTGTFVAKSGGNATSANYELRFNGTTTKPQFVIALNGVVRTADGATSLSNDTWYFLAGTWDGSYLRVYVNGVQDGISSAYTGQIPNTTTEPLSIAARRLVAGIQNPFAGKIADVRVYDGAATADELLSIMQE
jgi:hypothetical protein